MKRAEEYAAHAAECRQLAAKARSQDERDQLQAMAATWDNLATQRREFVTKYPEQTRQLEDAEDRGDSFMQSPAVQREDGPASHKLAHH